MKKTYIYITQYFYACKNEYWSKTMIDYACEETGDALVYEYIVKRRLIKMVKKIDKLVKEFDQRSKFCKNIWQSYFIIFHKILPIINKEKRECKMYLLIWL